MSLFGTWNHTLEIPIPNPKPQIPIWKVSNLGFGVWDFLSEAERQFDGRSARARAADSDPSLVRQHNLLHDGEAETGSARSRGEEWTEHLFTLPRGNTRSVILH